MARHNEYGKAGEDKAACYLQQKGFVILERNWRLKHREADIICERDDVVVIVEVKARTVKEERPGELLNLRKRKNLRQLADAYIKAKGIQKEVRFDLIVLTGEEMEIEHIEEAIQIFE